VRRWGPTSFGTLSRVACGIEGAIFGGVVGIELYKVVAARSLAPLAIGVAVGRIGPRRLRLRDTANWPWRHDFHDGAPRHLALLTPIYSSKSIPGYRISGFFLARRGGANSSCSHPARR
jgi:hypothetical protein